jgi:hypothetical protein
MLYIRVNIPEFWARFYVTSLTARDLGEQGNEGDNYRSGTFGKHIRFEIGSLTQGSLNPPVRCPATRIVQSERNKRSFWRKRKHVNGHYSDRECMYGRRRKVISS